MMILRTSAPSPYGRKIKIAASLLNLDKDIKVETADTNDPADTLRIQNPLGKIPILVLAGRPHLVRFARDHGISRSSGRRRPHHSRRARRPLSRAAPAGARRRHPRCIAPAGLRDTLPPGGPARAQMDRLSDREGQARLSMCSKRIRRRSTPCRMSDRSRSPARSAIRICASRACGGSPIRNWSPGSTISRARVPSFGKTKVEA